MLKAFCFILFISFSFAINAQEKGFNGFRQKNISTISYTIDTLSIVPNTFSIKNIDTSFYSINELKSIITWRKKIALDSVIAVYRVYPINMLSKKSRIDYDSVKNKIFINEAFVFNINTQTSSEVSSKVSGMNYLGSIGRSIALGNNQDANFLSSMNLQLSGFIGDSIQLDAAITDNNIPIQPEGNTQNLQEIDRVWMQVKKANWAVQMGDIDIRQSESKLLKFYKRLQGGAVDFSNKINKKITHQTLASIAVAKGKFSRNLLKPLDGNQGPYRLSGPNNELFFIILAGTERVYIDGELLQRGEDQDYIINYNTAELSFTPKRLVTKDLRIQVEFEFADRNYLNSQQYAHSQWQIGKKINIGVGLFSNTDARNSPINQILDDTTKQFLSKIGNGIDTAFFNTNKRDSAAPGKILYSRKDSFHLGNIYNIYEFSSDKSKPLYQVDFTFVGEGKGNYNEVFNAANGKVFVWSGLDANGERIGTYEPFSLIITPKKQQLFNIYTTYNLNSYQKINTELSTTNYDPNLYSAIDNNKNRGYGIVFNWLVENQPFYIKNKKHFLNGNISVDQFDKKFKALERYRPIEFVRDFGLPLDNIFKGEKFKEIKAEISDTSLQNNFGLSFQQYDNVDLKGNRYKTFSKITKNKFSFNSSIAYTQLSSSKIEQQFLNPNLGVKYKLIKNKLIEIGANYLLEYNKQKNILLDSLTQLSYGFSVINAFLNIPTTHNKYGFGFFTRQDRRPQQKNLLLSDRSYNYTMNGELNKNENRLFKWQLSYRTLKILNSNLTNLKNDQSVVGRLDYNFNEFKGFLNGSILTELGIGQEPKREFTFIQVATGQGEFYWVDYNNNNIQELNEFEQAVFADQKQYIKIFIPTLNYIKANYNQFNYQLDIDPKKIISQKAKSYNFFSKIFIVSTLQFSQKQIANNKLLILPFQQPTSDTLLVQENKIFSNALYINRNSAFWSCDISQNSNSAINLLSFGTEKRVLKYYTTKFRYNMSKAISASLSLKNNFNILKSSNAKFSNRNYNIEQYTVEPMLQYQYKNKWRLGSTLAFINKQNTIDSLEKLNAISLTIDGKYQIFTTSIIQAKVMFQENKFSAYQGAANTSIGFLMLDGLQPGKNFIWNVDYIKRFKNNIELTLRYEGRKSNTGNIIHTGNMGIRALFN